MDDDPATERLLRKLLAQLAEQEQNDPKEAAAAEVGLPVEHARRLHGSSHTELVADARKLASQLALPQTEQRFTEADVIEANRGKNQELTESLLPGIPGGAIPPKRKY